MVCLVGSPKSLEINIVFYCTEVERKGASYFCMILEDPRAGHLTPKIVADPRSGVQRGGVCVHLVTKYCHDQLMEEHQEPEVTDKRWCFDFFNLLAWRVW